MKVILLEDVKSLGKKGEVVSVNDGYARNFILKKNLGVEATSKSMNDLKLQKQNEEKVAAENLEKARKLGEELEGKSVTLSIKAGSGGRAFGSVSTKEISAAAKEQLELVHQGMYEKAKKNLDEHIFPAYSLEEAKQLQKEKGGFIKTMWCGELECEMKMKEEGGMSSRCMPFQQEHLSDVCPICGKPAKKMIYWGVAY